jgi:hypothetical protein
VDPFLEPSLGLSLFFVEADSTLPPPSSSSSSSATSFLSPVLTAGSDSGLRGLGVAFTTTVANWWIVVLVGSSPSTPVKEMHIFYLLIHFSET